MGKPGAPNRAPPRDEQRESRWSDTQGSETSQYLKEKKANAIAQVVASERAEA